MFAKYHLAVSCKSCFCSATVAVVIPYSGRFCGKPFCLQLKISPFKFKSSLVSVKEEDFLQSEYFANLAKSRTFNLINIFLLCGFSIITIASCCAWVSFATCRPYAQKWGKHRLNCVKKGTDQPQERNGGDGREEGPVTEQVINTND